MAQHLYCYKCDLAVCVDRGLFEMGHMTHKIGYRHKKGAICHKCRYPKGEPKKQEAAMQW